MIIHFLTLVISIIVTIMILIGIHELGHFLFAKLFRIKVIRFAIGFGQKLYAWQTKSGTEIRIGIIPLGGYVKMLDEREEQISPEELPHAFNQQAIWKRIIVLLAGPVFNILFALLAYWLMFVIGYYTPPTKIGFVLPNSIAAKAKIPEGATIISIDNMATPDWQHVAMALLMNIGNNDQIKFILKENNKMTAYNLALTNWKIDAIHPDPLTSLGIKPYTPPLKPIIAKITENSPAKKCNFKIGDTLLTIDGKKIENFQQFLFYLETHVKNSYQFTSLRNNKTIKFSCEAKIRQQKPGKQIAHFGIFTMQHTWPQNKLIHYQFSPGEALIKSVQSFWQFSKFNFIMLGKLISGKISLRSLGGPLSIIEGVNISITMGFVGFLWILALLSIAVAIINLLPIPGLDGAHILYLIIEKCRGRPLSTALQILLLRLGIIVLVLLMIEATLNDLTRILS